MAMATIKLSNKEAPATINTFLGLNESIETQLKLGESPYMVNFKVTDMYKLEKRYGYIQIIQSIGSPIRGMWHGKIKEAYYFLFACNGRIYKFNNDNTYTSIGTLTDDITSFFTFGDKLYILNGHEYKYWDGTTFGDVGGYRPLVVIGTPPTGGGTTYEEINLLNGERHQTFTPTEDKPTEYQLVEKDITSVDFVKVNGVLKTATTDYTADLVNGKVTFTSTTDHNNQIPDSIDIGWTKGNGDRAQVCKNYHAMLYGGSNDTRVFMWGNPDTKNRRIYTGLADGVPSAEYFPANSYSDVGNSEFAITDIVRQYDRQVIFKENEAFYSNMEETTDDTGATLVTFPVYPLNSEKGSVAPVQVVLNNPFSIQEGLYEWISTAVRAETNATYKSERVQSSLDNVGLKKAITLDYEKQGEYWLCVDNTIWVYNYRNDTWYKYVLYDAPICFLNIDGVLYFGTKDGRILKFVDGVRSDNGHVIKAEWDMGFYDWEYEYLNKYLNKIYISLMPRSKSGISVRWDTNRIGVNSIPVKIGYNLLDYDSIDYADWSYDTSYNPQPFRIKAKAKKFVYFKIILENSSLTDTVTILSISMICNIGGQAK